MTHNYGKFDRLVQLKGDHESIMKPFGGSGKVCCDNQGEGNYPPIRGS